MPVTQKLKYTKHNTVLFPASCDWWTSFDVKRSRSQSHQIHSLVSPLLHLLCPSQSIKLHCKFPSQLCQPGQYDNWTAKISRVPFSYDTIQNLIQSILQRMEMLSSKSM